MDQSSQVITVNAPQLRRILTRCLTNKRNVLITGAPGIGKSDVVSQVCAELVMDILITHPITSEPTDYKGLPSRSKDGNSAEFLPFGDLLQMMTATKPLAVFIDDLGQASPSVQAAIMQLLLARQINGKAISEHVTFVAATNRRKDRAGVSGILEPVKSRFATILELTPDWESWNDWAVNAGMPLILIGYLKANPGALFEPNPTQDLINSPSPRTWKQAGDLINDNMDEEDRLVTLAGAVGRGRAFELCTLWKMNESLTDPRELLNNPMNTALPENSDMLYAVCRAVIKHTTPKLMPKFSALLERICNEGHAEFSAMMLATLADDESKIGCFATKEYAELNSSDSKVGKLIQQASAI